MEKFHCSLRELEEEYDVREWTPWILYGQVEQKLDKRQEKRQERASA